MPDQYESVRTLTFPTLAAALGISLERFKTRKAGSEYYGACPIHKPKNNATSFSYEDVTGKFNCSSCSAKGKGAIDLAMKVKGVGFQEAVVILSSSASTTPPAHTPAKASSSNAEANGQPTEESSLKPYTGSYEKFKVESDWLNKRVPDESIREKYGVFQYLNPARKSAYSGRVMIPIKDVQGVIYGYLGRSFHTPDKPNHDNREPKYLFPRDFPKSKFAFGAAELKAGGPPLPCASKAYSSSHFQVRVAIQVRGRAFPVRPALFREPILCGVPELFWT